METSAGRKEGMLHPRSSRLASEFGHRLGGGSVLDCRHRRKSLHTTDSDASDDLARSRTTLHSADTFFPPPFRSTDNENEFRTAAAYGPKLRFHTAKRDDFMDSRERRERMGSTRLTRLRLPSGIQITVMEGFPDDTASGSGGSGPSGTIPAGGSSGWIPLIGELASLTGACIHGSSAGRWTG